MRPAYGYIRVSSDEQADSGLGLEAQRQRIRAYCELKGLTLTTLFALCRRSILASVAILLEQIRGLAYQKAGAHSRDAHLGREELGHGTPDSGPDWGVIVAG